MHIFELCHEKTLVGEGELKGGGVYVMRRHRTDCLFVQCNQHPYSILESKKATMHLLDPNVQV